MLCITPPVVGRTAKRVSPHILPCEISHTGTINAPKRFWNPQLVASDTLKAETGTVPDVAQANAGNGQTTQSHVPMSYFRGRKLLGRTCAVPEGYRGVVVSSEKNVIAQPEPEAREQTGTAFSRMLARREYGDDDDDDEEEEDDDDGYGHGEDNSPGEGEDRNSDDHVPLEGIQEISTFQDITVWEHDVQPGADEPFIRGVEEWLAFAQIVHGKPANSS